MRRLFLLSLFFLFNSCDLNLFSLNDDILLGEQVANEIESDPSTYPILSEEDYPEAYQHLRRIRDAVLDSGEVEHRDDFDWEVKIIQDDSVLNAFALPGGYLYFYTGLIKYLDNEDSFAGVMGHEIAHADKRHSTESLTREYGTSILLEIILGENQNILTDIARNLGSLQFSRTNESEADLTSVDYLDPTVYACNGAAGFFEKLTEEGGDSGPEFLSTHPNPDNRVEAIDNKANEINCSIDLSGIDYDDFKNSLP